MKIETSTVKKIRISDVDRLDPITVILEDIEPRKGKIIIECYGQSWPAYWGGMGDKTIAEFFCSCSKDYLAGSLSSISHTIDDLDAFQEIIKKRICQKRRFDEIDSYLAREWFDESDCVLGYSSSESLHAHDRYLSHVIGDEWWYDIPTKTNPDYAYLCRIIETVQLALKQPALEAAAQP